MLHNYLYKLVTLCMMDKFKLAIFCQLCHVQSNIKTISGTLNGSDLGSNCFKGLLAAIFLCHFRDKLIC